MHTVIVRRLTLWSGVAAIVAATLLARSAAAHTFCVNDANTFRAALAAASDGGAFPNEANVIQLAAGTYLNGGNRFVYKNGSADSSLDLSGGFDSLCIARTNDASLTMLDGGGTEQVMVVRSVFGDVTLSWLTVQNGETDQFGGGLGVDDVADTSGDITIVDTIIRNNHSSGGYGGLRAFAMGNHNIVFENNLVYGNSADAGQAAGALYAEGSVTLVQNTFAENLVIGGGQAAFTCYAPTDACLIANNVGWENGVADIAISNSAAAFNNDLVFSGTTSTSIGNFSSDPLFAGTMSGDFMLTPGSPAFAASDFHGNVSHLDIAGHPVPTVGRIDLGAYAETIFSDGNEASALP